MITRHTASMALLLQACLLHADCSAASDEVRRSLVSENGMPFDIVERHAQWNFGAGAIQTFNGWQYVTYWDDAKQVSIARRELPDGPWAVVSLPDYKRTSTGDRGKGGAISRGFGDGHEKVAMGISPDGYVHLSFDQHLSTLRYRRSIKPIAMRPEAVAWDDKVFGEVQDHLGLPRSGKPGDAGQHQDLRLAPKLKSVTYPRFVNHGDSMLLYLRMGGGSGSANSHLFRYSEGAWSPRDEPSSQFIDKQWSGGNGTVNAYPFGLVCGGKRCHLAYCWRDTPDHRTSHDLCYAYSDDGGVHWHNNEGQRIAARGHEFISPESPGITVVDVPKGSGYRNGGTMAVDDEGQVHVLARGANGAPTLYQRNPRTGEWTLQKAPELGQLLFFKEHLYLLSDDALYRGVPSKQSRFSIVASGFEIKFEDSKPKLDLSRPAEDGWISIIGQKGKAITVIDVKLE